MGIDIAHAHRRSGLIMTYRDTKCFRLRFASSELSMNRSWRIGRFWETGQQKARHLYDAGPVFGSEQEPLAKFSGRHGPAEEWG